jgi:hypothetical protein
MLISHRGFRGIREIRVSIHGQMALVEFEAALSLAAASFGMFA